MATTTTTGARASGLYVEMETDRAEYDHMWKGLRGLGFEIDRPDPASGERWQYMGTAPRATRDGAWWHDFRNRCEPSQGGRRVYAHVRASERFQQNNPLPEEKPAAGAYESMVDRMADTQQRAARANRFAKVNFPEGEPAF